MELHVHNKHSSKANGTSLTGYLDVSYQTLVELFGEPTIETDGYKVDAEWHVEFREENTDWTAPEDAFATIYNYKNGKNYCGADGLNVEDINSWHVGSKRKNDLYVLEEYIERKGKIAHAHN